MWFSRFCGVESKGFDRGGAGVDEDVATGVVDFSDKFREGEGRAGGVEEALEVLLLREMLSSRRSGRSAEGSSMGVRVRARE
jgi:hypothetical protein